MRKLRKGEDSSLSENRPDNTQPRLKVILKQLRLLMKYLFTPTQVLPWKRVYKELLLRALPPMTPKIFQLLGVYQGRLLGMNKMERLEEIPKGKDQTQTHYASRKKRKKQIREVRFKDRAQTLYAKSKKERQARDNSKLIGHSDLSFTNSNNEQVQQAVLTIRLSAISTSLPTQIGLLTKISTLQSYLSSRKSSPVIMVSNKL